MYFLKKRLEIAGSHSLNLNYESKCQNVHGHNWIITIYCKSEKLDENGMIIDFSEIKKIVNILDHNHINNYIKQPTAENIAEWLFREIPFCYQVDVQESENNIVTYKAD